MSGTTGATEERMRKQEILGLIIQHLTHDLELLLTAARTAHEASIHEENIPENKYDTLGLEASYVAQGQANRGQEIRRALQEYRRLSLQPFDDDTPIRLTALITLKGEDGSSRNLFIGPLEGGLKVMVQGDEVMVITPASPLGKSLMGRRWGDCIKIGSGAAVREYEIVRVC
jgi:transcription elongation GreA/GreB family factor